MIDPFGVPNQERKLRLYDMLSWQERVNTYRFSSVILQEQCKLLADYEEIHVDLKTQFVDGQIRYLKNVISGLKLAIYRTGINERNINDGDRSCL